MRPGTDSTTVLNIMNAAGTSVGSISQTATTATFNGALNGNASTVSNGVYTNATTNTLTGVFSVTRDAAGSDPYGPISVTRGTASNFSYYGLTRAGQVGWSIGVTTGNLIAFGTGASAAGVMTGTPFTCSSAGDLTVGAREAFVCRVWVNFNASSGSPSINADGGVSTVGDAGVGRFTVNFSTAMPDASYAIAGVCRWNQAGIAAALVSIPSDGTKSTTAATIWSAQSNVNSQFDSADVSAVFFR
jgi:hypothetical protein